MNVADAVPFSKRVHRFVKQGVAQVALTLAWLIAVGFLIAYLLSTVDPNSMSELARLGAGAVTVGVLFLPFMVVSWDFKKFLRRHRLLCESCGGNLAASRKVIQHVTKRSVCPYCGHRIDDH
jgi:hypothetical protein